MTNEFKFQVQEPAALASEFYKLMAKAADDNNYTQQTDYIRALKRPMKKNGSLRPIDLPSLWPLIEDEFSMFLKLKFKADTTPHALGTFLLEFPNAFKENHMALLFAEFEHMATVGDLFKRAKIVVIIAQRNQNLVPAFLNGVSAFCALHRHAKSKRLNGFFQYLAEVSRNFGPAVLELAERRKNTVGETYVSLPSTPKTTDTPSSRPVEQRQSSIFEPIRTVAPPSDDTVHPAYSRQAKAILRALVPDPVKKSRHHWSPQSQGRLNLTKKLPRKPFNPN